MTPTHKTPRVRYTADGKTKTFTVPFQYTDQSDLSVILYYNDKSQLEGTIESSTGAGNPNGGTITLTVAPYQGVIVTILGAMPHHQSNQMVVPLICPKCEHQWDSDKMPAPAPADLFMQVIGDAKCPKCNTKNLMMKQPRFA